MVTPWPYLGPARGKVGAHERQGSDWVGPLYKYITPGMISSTPNPLPLAVESSTLNLRPQ